MSKEPTIETRTDYSRFIETVLTRKDRLFYVGLSMRPGVHVTGAAVEYHNFHPDFHGNNELFELDLIVWEELQWLVFSVPREYEEKVKNIAEILNMRVADGVPFIVTQNGLRGFPGATEAEIYQRNMYSIENGKGNVVYANRKDLEDAVKERESEMVEKLAQHGPMFDLRKVSDYIWGFSGAKTRQ